MQRRYIRMSELASTPTRKGRYPVTSATIWRWVNRGLFPKPVQLGPGTSAWDLSLVEEHEAAQAEKTACHEAQFKAAAASILARRAQAHPA